MNNGSSGRKKGKEPREIDINSDRSESFFQTKQRQIFKRKENVRARVCRNRNGTINKTKKKRKKEANACEGA